MSEWRSVNLGELTELVTKGTTPPTVGEGFTKSGVNYIKSEAVGYDGRINKSNFVFISPEMHEKFKRSQLKENDILFSMAGVFLGKNALVTKEMLPANTNQALAIIRLDHKKATPLFVHYFLRQQSTIELVNNMSGQSAQPNINFQEIRSIKLSLPDVHEQKAIVAVLSSLDDKIDLLHRQNRTLEAMAETLFRQWFVDGAQEDWGAGVINNLVEILSGFPFKSSTFIESGKYQLITIKAVQDGYLELSGADKLTEIPPNMPGYCRLKNGDILLSLTGNVGRCCLVDNDGLLLNQRVAKLQPRHVRDWAFTYVLFRQLSMKRTLEELAKGTAQANLSPIETSNMEFSIPPISILEKYDECATPILKKVLRNKVQIKILERLRDTLLPKLMSGEVRVAA